MCLCVCVFWVRRSQAAPSSGPELVLKLTFHCLPFTTSGNKYKWDIETKPQYHVLRKKTFFSLIILTLIMFSSLRGNTRSDEQTKHTGASTWVKDRTTYVRPTFLPLHQLKTLFHSSPSWEACVCCSLIKTRTCAALRGRSFGVLQGNGHKNIQNWL